MTTPRWEVRTLVPQWLVPIRGLALWTNGWRARSPWIPLVPTPLADAERHGFFHRSHVPYYHPSKYLGQVAPQTTVSPTLTSSVYYL